MKPQPKEHKVSEGTFFNISKIRNNLNNIKNYTAHPNYKVHMYLQSFEKIQRCVFELQCENETWRTDGRTGRQTDRLPLFIYYLVKPFPLSLFTIWWNQFHCLCLLYSETTAKGTYSKWWDIFQYFIQSISKTIQHTSITWCTYLQSFEKIQQVTVQKLNVTDRQTDRWTDRRG